MKKHFLALLLVAFMLLSLTACVVTDTQESKPANQDGTPSAAPSDSQQDNGQSESTTPNEALASDSKITFDGLTVVDNDECSVIITEIAPDNLWGYTLRINLENKSAEKTYMFSVTSAAVDGLQCDPSFATEVAAGKKAIDSISFFDPAFEGNNIDFTDIELTFRVYDSNDWMADAVAVETVHVYPYGEGKAEIFERAPQPSDNVIIDNEYVTVTVIGYDADNIMGYTINLFLQNKAGTEVMFSIDEASVNGYMADPFWATSVLPGKCAFSSISWFDTTLQEIGVTEVEEVEFILRAYDYEDWTADDFANETITLHP